MSSLTYPFEDRIPRPAEELELADGVHWLRMPMPGRLDHINVWLLRDGDGWTIVDTGLQTDEIVDCWERVFAKHLEGRPVTRVIVTHMHPDHVGLAGWLVKYWDVELWMSRADYFMCKVMAGYRPSDIPEDGMRFFRRAGFSEENLNEYRKRFGTFGSRISPLPASYHRLIDEETLEIDGRDWRIVVGRGHSPEHACLYSSELRILISGDQVLPRITSNVSVNPSEPHADPLGEWLDSCARFRKALPEDLLVLPAHQDPFYGLHDRLGELVEYHEDALGKLHELCVDPKRAVDVFDVLFKSHVADRDATFFAATGESVAHLQHAERRGLLLREVDADGVVWYRRNSGPQEPRAWPGPERRET